MDMDMDMDMKAAPTSKFPDSHIRGKRRKRCGGRGAYIYIYIYIREIVRSLGSVRFVRSSGS